MYETTGSTLFPLHRCKTVHLVRHAQGTHNVEGEKDHSAYLSPKHFDAQITPLGWKQVEHLRKHVQSSGLSKKLDLVIVSPLLRTLQTAAGVFGGEEYTDGPSAPPLMVANVESCGRSAVSSINCPPFLAVEKCRERIGLNPCDKRRSINEYQELFPAIDFSMVENNDDVLWTDKIRESNDHLEARGMEFFNWLWTLKEKEIAIVTHSAFLYHSLRNFTTDCHPPMKKEIDEPNLGSGSSSTNYLGMIPK